MRALLPLLVACGGSGNVAPPDSAGPIDAPPVPHFALDFTFGTNGEALVTPPTSTSATHLDLVANAVGLFIATDGPSNHLCKTNLHGKVDATFGSSGCILDPGIVDHGALAPTGTGLVTVGGSTIYWIDASGGDTSLPLAFAPSLVLVESETTAVVADLAGHAAHLANQAVDATAQLGATGDELHGLVPGPTFLGAHAGQALAIRTSDALAVTAGYASGLSAPAIERAYPDDDGVVVSGPSGVFRLDNAGALDVHFGTPIATQPTAVGVLPGRLVAVATGTTLSVVDHLGDVSTDLAPLPTANAPTSLISIIATSEGGFIVAGFTANGQSVALVHYVPQ